MSRSFVLWAFSLLLVSGEVFAAGECARQGIAEREGIPAGSVVWVEGTEPVLLEVGGKLETGSVVGLEVRVDGEMQWLEELEIVEGTAESIRTSGGGSVSGRVVEMLAANPARLDGLRLLAETSVVEVSVSLDGARLETLHWVDLVNRSEGLRNTEARPLAVRTELRLSGAGSEPQASISCSNTCQFQQQVCYVGCGQNPVPSCLSACDQAYTQCLQGCGICQPSTTTSTSFSTVSITYSGINECRYDQFALPGRQLGIFRRNNALRKKTVTTTTTNADCSRTVTTNVTYFTQVCWSFYYEQSCSSLGPATPICN